jgi:two-component system OmpR family response regulator
MNTLDVAMNLQSLILVVDDDPDLRKLIGDFLLAHGYRAATAENVAEMRRSIEVERPDLVILNAMIPREDGSSAARRLAAGRGPAVNMLSALGSDTDRIIGLEVGADDYLVKPCNPRELLARVRAVLRRRRTDQPDTAAQGRGACVSSICRCMSDEEKKRHRRGTGRR